MTISISAAIARPDFKQMTDKALAKYLLKHVRLQSADDLAGTRKELQETAEKVFDRHIEEFQAAKEKSDALNATLDAASAALQKYPKGTMGLTPDDVKRSAAWRADNAAFNRAFSEIRKFNSTYTKVFATELRQLREAKRQAQFAAYKNA